MIDKNSPIPVYYQLKEMIKEKIADGLGDVYKRQVYSKRKRVNRGLWSKSNDCQTGFRRTSTRRSSC